MRGKKGIYVQFGMFDMVLYMDGNLLGGMDVIEYGLEES